MNTSPITTHVLDTSIGKPAAGVDVVLEVLESGGVWTEVGNGSTNADGRITDLLRKGRLNNGTYRVSFATADYFARQKVAAFYPRVRIEFEIKDTDEHYHVPLLLNPFGYSTYRGS